jgi:hypothetical protein
VSERPSGVARRTSRPGKGFPNPYRVSLAYANQNGRIQQAAERPKQNPTHFFSQLAERAASLQLAETQSSRFLTAIRLASIRFDSGARGERGEERYGNRLERALLPASSVASSSLFIPAPPADSPDRAVVRPIPRHSLSLWFGLDLSLFELWSASSV